MIIAGDRNTTTNCLYKVLKEHNENYAGELSQVPFMTSYFNAICGYFKDNAVLSLQNLTTLATVPGVFTQFEIQMNAFVANSKSQAHAMFAANVLGSLATVSVNGISFLGGISVMNLEVNGPEYEDCLEQLSVGFVNWCKSLQLNSGTNFRVLSII